MKATLESTTRIVTANGVECRVWRGQTASGIKVQCLIPRIAVEEGQDVREFERELEERHAPSAEPQAFPLRMIL